MWMLLIGCRSLKHVHSKVWEPSKDLQVDLLVLCMVLHLESTCSSSGGLQHETFLIWSKHPWRHGGCFFQFAIFNLTTRRARELGCWTWLLHLIALGTMPNDLHLAHAFCCSYCDAAIFSHPEWWYCTYSFEDLLSCERHQHTYTEELLWCRSPDHQVDII